MAKREGQKVKGCKKCGRKHRQAFRAAKIGNATSLYVRDKISAKEYFVLTNQAHKA